MFVRGPCDRVLGLRARARGAGAGAFERRHGPVGGNCVRKAGELIRLSVVAARHHAWHRCEQSSPARKRIPEKQPIFFFGGTLATILHPNGRMSLGLMPSLIR